MELVSLYGKGAGILYPPCHLVNLPHGGAGSLASWKRLFHVGLGQLSGEGVSYELYWANNSAAGGWVHSPVKRIWMGHQHLFPHSTPSTAWSRLLLTYIHFIHVWFLQDSGWPQFLKTFLRGGVVGWTTAPTIADGVHVITNTHHLPPPPLIPGSLLPLVVWVAGLVRWPSSWRVLSPWWHQLYRPRTVTPRHAGTKRCPSKLPEHQAVTSLSALCVCSPSSWWWSRSVPYASMVSASPSGWLARVTPVDQEAAIALRWVGLLLSPVGEASSLWVLVFLDPQSSKSQRIPQASCWRTWWAELVLPRSSCC